MNIIMTKTACGCHDLYMSTAMNIIMSMMKANACGYIIMNMNENEHSYEHYHEHDENCACGCRDHDHDTMAHGPHKERYLSFAAKRGKKVHFKGA